MKKISNKNQLLMKWINISYQYHDIKNELDNFTEIQL